MSQRGYLVWYTDRELTDLPISDLLKSLPEAIGFERALAVYRDDLETFLGENVLASELYRLYSPGATMFVELEDARIAETVAEAVERDVPDEVRSGFTPDEAFFKIGEDAYFVDARKPKKKIPYTVMVGCFGNAVPEREIYEILPGISQLSEEKANLEKLFGPMVQTLYLKF